MFKFQNKGISLIELLVSFIIIGILQVVGISYYCKVIERARSIEAVEALTVIRNLGKIIYQENGKIDNFDFMVAGFPVNCAGQFSHYFSYVALMKRNDILKIQAMRCANKTGKKTSALRPYFIILETNYKTGKDTWSYS